mmetsp:Transcript_3420/g.10457  ORF Transcript_3420/g.10457 Transcript_3420/m.10457 type:complete len:340 (+) Transcript_3420:727-1746(+)
MPRVDVQRVLRIRKVRDRVGLLLLERGAAGEADRERTQIHRRQSPASHRVQAKSLQRRRELRAHQPKGHRSPVAGHVGEGRHLRGAARQAPQHGAHRAGVRRFRRELLRRPRRVATGLRRPRVRSEPGRRELHVHRRRAQPQVLHHPHQRPQQAHDRANQGRRPRRPPRRVGRPRGQLRPAGRRRLRGRRLHGLGNHVKAPRHRQEKVRHPGLRRRSPRHPQNPRRKFRLRRPGLHRQAPGRPQRRRPRRPRPPVRRTHRPRRPRRLRRLPHQKAIHPPRHHPRHPAPPRRRGHQGRQANGQTQPRRRPRNGLVILLVLGGRRGPLRRLRRSDDDAGAA